jgi:hypothetical protein
MKIRIATLLAEDRWTTAHEEGLDTVLIPFFWAEVNSRLKHPFELPVRRVDVQDS